MARRSPKVDDVKWSLERAANKGDRRPVSSSFMASIEGVEDTHEEPTSKVIAWPQTFLTSTMLQALATFNAEASCTSKLIMAEPGTHPRRQICKSFAPTSDRLGAVLPAKSWNRNSEMVMTRNP